MKAKDKPEIKEALDAADHSLGNAIQANNHFYFLLRALVLAVCEVADGINQIVADLPSHDT